LGAKVQLHVFLTSVLDRGDWSASSSGPGTHWIGALMDHTAGLDAVAMRKNGCPCRESSLCCPVCSL